MVAVGLAHHLLQYDSHLFLVDDIAGGGHVGLGIAVVHRGIHAFDGGSQHAEHLVFVVKAWNQVGGVDAGKGLVV